MKCCGMRRSIFQFGLKRLADQYSSALTGRELERYMLPQQPRYPYSRSINMILGDPAETVTAIWYLGC